MRPRRLPRKRMRGVALPVVLVTLVMTLLLAVSAAGIVREGERAVQGDRDRRIAMEAAEAALRDAERDIEGVPSAPSLRRAAFTGGGTAGFIEGCGMGEGTTGQQPNPWQGLCAPSAMSPMSPMSPKQATSAHASIAITPAWIAVDLDARGADAARTVAFGRYTGARMPTGEGLPAQLPRYLIEVLPDSRPGLAADLPAAPAEAPSGEAGQGGDGPVLYRITAIGFGVREATRVVLQTVYRRGGT